MVTNENKKIIRDSDYVVFNNNRIGASVTPILFWNNLRKKKTSGISMFCTRIVFKEN